MDECVLLRMYKKFFINVVNFVANVLGTETETKNRASYICAMASSFVNCGFL